MKELGVKCTVLVSSCDKYEDVWVPFFKIFKEQWADRPYPIILNTESKSFDYEDMNIKTFNFYKQNEKVNWGERLIKTLEAINSEYIIFTLDDYFLLKPVKQEIIDKCMKWMDNDKNIACFYYSNRGEVSGSENPNYPGYIIKPQCAPWKCSAQTSLWRKDILIKYVEVTDRTALEWEVAGSRRAWKYEETLYSTPPWEPSAFVYDSINYAIVDGKWAKNIPQLFESYSIKMDFLKRGFV